MKVLVSPMSLEEAIECIKGGADIIDVKNPAEGSLGANFPHVIKEVSELVKKNGKEVSATIGDMEFKPGTASLAALGAAFSGADYVKVGLYGVRSEREVYEMMKEVVRAVKDFDEGKKVVAAAYGDYTRIRSVSPFDIPEASYKAGADGIMVDTAIKDGKDIFSFMKFEELERFIEEAHKRGMFCAIAGSLKWEHIEILKKLNPDIIGVRTMVCESGRNSSIKAELVEKLTQALR
ncbi:(5-formylfuran-3-yl)methyl phosphate synthase [Ferroglobus sp.]|uniref:(5-formylfuran-3-yl)methyl phosphate synthase n=1 Tax=Ferroglobus sp. TaxID=2614230 RepID=UPI0025BE1130|nr:(5-formylfuran-3-yl)methyl phosphate synthase [Ferroglobus sp.]